jgi:hypothetical protein
VDTTRTRGRTVFAFLSYTAAETTSALSIIHSLIFQLSADDADLQTVICESSRENFESNLDAALGILRTLLLSCIDTVYVVIDGLDEINELQRILLVKHLLEILQGCDEVRICLSSRPEADLKMKLDSKATSIRVDARNAESIQHFVKQWTEDWFERRQIYSQARVDIWRLLAPLAEKSKGV